MRIGITYDLKSDASARTDVPDDFYEEFDSPVTIEAIAKVLRGLGHQVMKLGDGRGMLEQLLAAPPDFVFNFAEGQGIGRSREARVPAVLEMLGIPYTGSDPLTLAVTLDKDCAKRLVASAGVAVPKGIEVSSARALPAATLQFPVIVKPAWEGSSKGVRGKSLVHRQEDLQDVVAAMLHDYDQPMLVEEYIEGEELTVGMLGNKPSELLGIMRVVPLGDARHFIYSLEVKRDYERRVRYECPAQVSPRASEAVRQAAQTVWCVLGCRDVSRIDFRLKNDVPYFLEVNPLPGLNPETSDLVIMARLAGWKYEKLIETILAAAMERSR